MSTNFITFPGLGIGPIEMNKVAFTLFGRDIAWYGIIICLGVILALIYAMRKIKFEKLNTDDFLDVVIVAIPLAIVFARAYYVIFDPNPHYETFIDYIAVWKGGIAIYGAIIGGALAVVIMSKIKKLPMLKVFDSVAPALLIGQIVGRFGNFVNAEAHGGETDIFIRMGISPFENGPYKYYHPTFLYESLWNLVGFLIIHFFYRHKKYDGQILIMYATWYGLGRFFIEGLRTDSLYVGHFRVSQLIAGICFIAGLTLLIIFGIKNRKAVKNGNDN